MFFLNAPWVFPLPVFLLCLFWQCLTYSFLPQVHSLRKFRSFPCHFYFLDKLHCFFSSLLLISTPFRQFLVIFGDQLLLPHCFSYIPESGCICLDYGVLLTMSNVFLLSFIWHSVAHVTILGGIATKLYILCLSLCICFCFYILFNPCFFIYILLFYSALCPEFSHFF